MKTIKSLKDITTLEVGDKVVFGNLEYEVTQGAYFKRYYLILSSGENDKIFNVLNIDKEDFIDKLGIKIAKGLFPETYSLETLTALVSALFKEYEKQQNVLPKTWDEFCIKNKIKDEESYISTESQIRELFESERNSITDRNVCTSKLEAKAFLALMQLRQLRKAYVKDWEPDWTNSNKIKYCIKFYDNKIRIDKWALMSQVLSFPAEELAQQFLTNFKNLIEIAKPLL